ncbi:uncharacterized protein LOC34619749 [Cyclospora cayetanensis]|uniref:Uncharacterized protein LOC34619749 n=1 Tax=Cyclospora cayetanensis TaxID=88456 RepID=A0A6P6S2F0_9EIME|nr:uncharacterized protein LOC34619749 [Cyclospora cayetanensis]
MLKPSTDSPNPDADDEVISFPLSQPDPLPRRQNQDSSTSAQRRRRSAACCTAPYALNGHQQAFNRLQCTNANAAKRQQHAPPTLSVLPLECCLDTSCEEEAPTAEEAERAVTELADAATASASLFAAEAKAVDPTYAAKPTAFLYKGHTAQIATSTAGMYGEMIESFIKQVVAYAKQYGADEFSVFCDLGSGRGAPSAIAAYEHDWLACLGIEKCPQAFGLSLETQRRLLLREASERLRSRGTHIDSSNPLEEATRISNDDIMELFEARPKRAVAFSHDDLSAFVDLEGVTHGYSFDAAMEGPLINHITQMFMNTETWWFYLSFRNDLISRFDLRGAELKHQISSNMWVSFEGRTAYIYVKTDWKERQQHHRRWLRERLLGPQLQQQAKQQQLLQHVRLQQQLVLHQLQREEKLISSSCAKFAHTAATESSQRTPRSSRRKSMSPMGTPRSRSASRRRQSTAGDNLQQRQQDMVLFHLASRRQQLRVLDEFDSEHSIWEGLQQQHQGEAVAASDRALLEQLQAFRSTHLRLSKWHQPQTAKSLLLVALLPFEGQNQWLQLQQQLLQSASGVLTRAQRLLLLGYDEGQKREEELLRDQWLEQLATLAAPEEADALRSDIITRLTKQRTEDMSLFTFLPPDSNPCARVHNAESLLNGSSLRLGFRHSLKELQEKQSPMRWPLSRASCTPTASREPSPVGQAPSAEFLKACDTPSQKQSLKQRRQSPVRQAARRRTNSQTMSPVSSRRRCSAIVASAALAAADAAARSSPVKQKGGAFSNVGTPTTRRAVQRVESDLCGLTVSGKDIACDPHSAPVSQNSA